MKTQPLVTTYFRAINLVGVITQLRKANLVFNFEMEPIKF